MIFFEDAFDKGLSHGSAFAPDVLVVLAPQKISKFGGESQKCGLLARVSESFEARRSGTDHSDKILSIA